MMSSFSVLLITELTSQLAQISIMADIVWLGFHQANVS